MPAEKQFENRVKAWLQTKGIYPLGTPKQKMSVAPIGYYEKRWGNAMTVSGLPDMHIVIGCLSIEIELKAPKGRASDLQIFMINQIRECDGYAYIMYEFEKNIPTKYKDLCISFEKFKEFIGDICKHRIQE